VKNLIGQLMSLFSTLERVDHDKVALIDSGQANIRHVRYARQRLHSTH
jgi:hypothetical protein